MTRNLLSTHLSSASRKRQREGARQVQDALSAKGVRTVERMLATSDVEIQNALRGVLKEKQVVRMKNVLSKKTMALGYKLEDLVDFAEQYVKKLSTGCDSIDRLLGGGIPTGEVTEVAGATATGKTQLAKSTVATLLLDNPDVRAVYFDTCNCFSAVRLQEILLEKSPQGIPVEERKQIVLKALERVSCVQVYDVFSLSQALAQLFENEQASKHYQAGPLRLLVIDSVTSIFAASIGGHGKSSGVSSYAAMNQLASLLQEAAFSRNLAVLTTNSVVHARQGDQENAKPALGRSWSKEASTRIQLVCNQQCTKLKAALTKSCRVSLAETPPVNFSITSRGLVDAQN